VLCIAPVIATHRSPQIQKESLVRVRCSTNYVTRLNPPPFASCWSPSEHFGLRCSLQISALSPTQQRSQLRTSRTQLSNVAPTLQTRQKKDVQYCLQATTSFRFDCACPPGHARLIQLHGLDFSTSIMPLTPGMQVAVSLNDSCREQIPRDLSTHRCETLIQQTFSFNHAQTTEGHVRWPSRALWSVWRHGVLPRCTALACDYVSLRALQRVSTVIVKAGLYRYTLLYRYTVYGIRYIHRYICNLRYKGIIRRIRIPLKTVYLLSGMHRSRKRATCCSQHVAHERVRNRAMRHKHSVQQVLLMYQL
jgi:hypothetical protein